MWQNMVLGLTLAKSDCFEDKDLQLKVLHTLVSSSLPSGPTIDFLYNAV